jgi:hypothetical protein
MLPSSFIKQYPHLTSQVQDLKLRINTSSDSQYTKHIGGRGMTRRKWAAFTRHFAKDLTRLEILRDGSLLDKFDARRRSAIFSIQELMEVAPSKLRHLSLTRWILNKHDIKFMPISFPALRVLHLDNTAFQQNRGRVPPKRAEDDTWFTAAKLLRDEYKGLCKLEFGNGPFF